MQGAQVRCVHSQVVVGYQGKVLQRLPQEQVERVLLLGRVGLTTGFLDLALSRGIPVTFLTQEGRYKGRLEAGGRRDVALRLAQYALLGDAPRRLAISREVVRAKVLTQRGLLMRCARNHPRPELTAGARAMERVLADIGSASTIPELMGLEGRAAREYFAALPHALMVSVPFHGRSRRPPKDPVNALLSLGYGLLTAELIGALHGAGLDPQLGIFHKPRGRVPALAEDVLEPFRAPVSDSLAITLVNLRVLGPDEFREGDGGGVLLTKRGLETYFRQYRRRMQARFRNREGTPTCYRMELQKQAAHLRRVVLGEEEYRPFVAPMGGANRGAMARKEHNPALTSDERGSKGGARA